MDSATEELYFQKIQELVQDDDKIVTISSLASNLNISLQNSRNLISKYVEDHRKLNPEELTVTYVVSGILLNSDGKKGVFMAEVNDLEEKRKLFENKPCEVVFSVQKNRNVDFNIIALVDMFNSTNIRETALPGSIVGKNCTKRTLKFKKLPSPPPPTIKGKSSFFTPKVEPSTSSEKPAVSPQNQQKAKPSGGIADLFKSGASKPKNGSKSASPKPSKPAPKKGGLSGFLTNGTSKSSTVFNSNQNKIKSNSSNGDSNSESQNSIKEDIADMLDVIITDEAPEEVKVQNGEVKKETLVEKSSSKAKTGSQGKQKGSKRQRDKSKEMPSKKRKRIIQRNDSDSDDMFEKDNDNEDIIERSDEEPERVPSPVVQKPIVPKNKRRKAVTRNYEDEEGFIVTKTEYIYETASEDENTEPSPPKQEKKEAPPAPKQKVAEKKKPAKNQSTLMNFFKKK